MIFAVVTASEATTGLKWPRWQDMLGGIIKPHLKLVTSPVPPRPQMLNKTN